MCVGVKIQLVGDGVVATFVKRGAASNPFGPHPATSEQTKAFDRLVGVVRAGGGVDAVISQHGGEKVLIKTDDFKKEPGHFRFAARRLARWSADPPGPEVARWRPEFRERWPGQWGAGR